MIKAYPSIPKEGLYSWFEKHKRDLPWRKTQNPYHVLLSEMMLQQTQVKTVLDYYRKWINKYPTLKKLSEGNETEVLKLWAGLGYYSRAKNLLKISQIITQKYHGIIPEDYNTLTELPGIGDYTASAIISFAYKKPAVVLDGNIQRVLSRYIGYGEDLFKKKGRDTLYEYSKKELDEENPHIYNEALMELGALTCLPSNPLCPFCPLKENCISHQKKLQNIIPFKKKKNPKINIHRLSLVISHKDHYLMRKTTSGKLLLGLWEFYNLDFDTKKEKDQFIHQGNIPLIPYYSDLTSDFLCYFSHYITQYKIHVDTWKILSKKKYSMKNYHWIPKKEIKKYPLSSSSQKILNLL